DRFSAFTHPADAQLLDDAVVGDGLADHCAEILGLNGGRVNEVPDAPVSLELRECMEIMSQGSPIFKQRSSSPARLPQSHRLRNSRCLQLFESFPARCEIQPFVGLTDLPKPF